MPLYWTLLHPYDHLVRTAEGRSGMAVMMWVLIVGVVLVLIALHAHYDQRERDERVDRPPRWWREAMDRWGGGFD